MAASTSTSAAATSASPLTILVTGANRGIGLALIEQYAAQPNVRVIGTARDPAKADALQALAKAKPNAVAVVALDVSDAKSVAALPGALAALKPPVKALDVLINNAGIVQGSGSSAAKPHGVNAWGGLEHESIDNFMQIYRTNVVGTFDVTQRVLPLLRAAPSRNAKIINISSLAGQFEFTIEAPPQMAGGAAAYRTSKTALNELSAVQAREYNAATLAANTAAAAAPGDAKLAAAAAAAAPLIAVLTVHPGVVETDMAAQAGFSGLPIAVTTAVSAAGIIKLTAEAKASHKVKFVDAVTLKEIAW